MTGCAKEMRFDGYVGVDEAGRGCLAGPVVAGAVLFERGFDFDRLLPGLDDSKKLAVGAREALAVAVKRHALCWRVGLSWPDEIDSVNILNATFRAMSRAVSRLKFPGPPPPLVIDGNHIIRRKCWLAVTDRPLPDQTAVIDGDALVPAISAASVLAKTFRDKLMAKLDARHPGYGFAAHKGYGTKEHREAIKTLGACPLHRKTFRGVRPEEQQLTLF